MLQTETHHFLHESPPHPELIDESEYSEGQLIRLFPQSFKADLTAHIDDFSLTDQEKENILQLLERFPLSFRKALIDLIEQWNSADRHARYTSSTSFESGEYVLTSCGDPICRVENLHYSSPRLTLYGQKKSQEDARPLLEVHRHTIYELLLKNLLSSRLYAVYFATS